MYSSTIRRGRIFHFRADKATLTSQGTNSPQISAPLDWSGNYTPSIVNSGYTTTSGWSGTGTTLDPYRLILDGVNDYLDTKHIPQLTDKWSMELWIKIPNVVSKETTTIWGTNGTGNGYWMPGFSYSKSNKKLIYGHDYYGNPTFEYGTIADHVINPGDIIQIGLVFDGCKHVQLYLNGILLMDSTFTLTPTATSSNLIGGNIPTTAYYGYGNIEVISCSIFSKLLSATEILRSYQGNEDPLYKTSLSQMNRGDYISCRYTATSGQVGTFSELGTCIAPEIPVAGTATPNGLFYFIMAGYDSQGGKKLVSDRNLQTNISWDAINNAGMCSGLNLNYNLLPLKAAWKMNEVNGSIVYDLTNQYNLTCTGTTIVDTDNGGKGRYFDGASRIMSSTLMPIPLGKKVIRTRFKKSSIPTVAERLFDQRASGAAVYLLFTPGTGCLAYSIETLSGTVLNISSPNNVCDNSYHDVVIVVDTNKIDMYIDKIKVSTLDTTSISEPNFVSGTSCYFTIGDDSSGSRYLTNTTIDYLEIFNDIIPVDTNIFGMLSSIRPMTGGTSTTDKDNEWDKIIAESSLGGTITPGDDNVWHWQNLWSWTSTTNYSGPTVRVVRGNSAVTTSSQTDSTLGKAGFRPVMLVEDTSAPVVTVTKFMIQQGTNIFDINPANYSTPPTNIAELHVVEQLTNTIIEQSGGGWNDVVNYLSLFKGAKYKILKFVRNQ